MEEVVPMVQMVMEREVMAERKALEELLFQIMVLLGHQGLVEEEELQEELEAAVAEVIMVEVAVAMEARVMLQEEAVAVALLIAPAQLRQTHKVTV